MRGDRWLFSLGFLLAATVLGAEREDPAEAEGPRFLIRQYRVEGAHRLSDAALQAAVAPFTGDHRELATIQQAIGALEQAYAAAGFSAVKVILPRQELDEGVVRLEVVEGTVGAVVIEGNQYFGTANIRRALPQLREGEVPNTRDIGAGLRLANESMSRQAQVTFRPGEQPDSVDALIRVSDESPLRQALILDNTGTAQTSRLRLGYALQHANLFDRDHTLAVQYVTSPDRPQDVSILGGNYHIPLYTLGGALDVSASHSNVDSGIVGTTAGTYSISGSGDTVGLRYTQLLARQGAWDQRISLGLDYRVYRNDISLTGTSTSLLPDLVVHPVTLGYSGSMKTPAREWGGSLSYTQNLPEGGRGGTTLFQKARAGAEAGYRIAHYSAYLNQALPLGWQVRAQFSGQYTTDSLISGEQFGLGGADSVRGFEERQVLNDRGLRASLELYSPELAMSGVAGGLRTQGVLFYDAGSTSRNHALPGEITQQNLASVGLGVRMAYGSRLRLRVDVANVLSGGGSARQPGDKMAQGNLILLF